MMDADLHQAQLLLPPLFVTEVDELPSSGSEKRVFNHFFGSRSGLVEEEGALSSSPSGRDSGPISSSGSEDSDEEEDEYMSALTRQMAHRMLQEDDDINCFSDVPGLVKRDKPSQSWGSAVSPQSTLWSPFMTGQGRKDRVWDTSYDFASLSEKFEKIDLDGKEPLFSHFHGTLETGQSSFSAALQNPGFLHHPLNRSLSDDEIRVTTAEIGGVHLERAMRRSGSMNMKMQGGTEWSGRTRARSVPSSSSPPSSPSPSTSTARWHAPPLHQQQQHPNQMAAYRRAGSGMRAVFLGRSGVGNGSSGTGVFLPRGAGNPPESRKKPRCSTVLIPARVAQALMVHFDKMGAPSRPAGGCFPLQHDTGTGRRSSSGLHFQQMSQSQAAPALNFSEIGLPQEWMY